MQLRSLLVVAYTIVGVQIEKKLEGQKRCNITN